jgi:hypothetical protein
MGEVYRARDTKLDRDVALKVLPTHVAADPERIARFEREAKTLAALNHQHIAAIYGIEESDGTSALILDRMTKRTSLYVRSLDRFESQPIRGTDGGQHPFFSPDGEWVGYFVPSGPGDDATLAGQLMKVAVSGGPAIALSNAVVLGGAWLDDGSIVFSRGDADGIGLFRLPSNGGAPERLTEPQVARGDVRHGWPEHVAGANAVLFSISGPTTFSNARVTALSLRTGLSIRAITRAFCPAGILRSRWTAT